MLNVVKRLRIQSTNEEFGSKTLQTPNPKFLSYMYMQLNKSAEL
jgi:hypothetical protein